MTEDVYGLLWGLAAILALLLVWVYRRWRRRALPPRETPALPPTPAGVVPEPDGEPLATRFPIVLAHGWMGFDVLALPGGTFRREYFHGVRACLEACGHRVHTVRVSPFGTISERAEQLRKQLERLDVDKVNIIAHSMGGLDARYAISRLGVASRVASLITVGTPHYGTPIADSGNVIGNVSLLRRMMRSLGGRHYGGMFDLSTARMVRFNERVPNADGVFYGSYVAAVEKGRGRVNGLLAPAYTYLNWRAGKNDGLIPASSQEWGELLGEICADHWAQIGWSAGFDACAFYRDLAWLLARRGL